MDFIERVNRIKITPELLIEANLAVAKMESTHRLSLTARSNELIKIIDYRKMSLDQTADLLIAISFRLEALARLEIQKHKEMGAWSRPGDETGKVFISEDLFEAAALEPMIRESERPAFEPVSFFQRLLAISQEHGRG